MIATRSQRVSASSMWCVVSTTVRPSALICRSRSQRFRRACGSSAPVGSSRNSSSGPCTSAQAIDSRCAWPPESFSVRMPACSSRPTTPSISSARLAGTPYSEAKVCSCSRAVSRSKNDEACSWTPIRGSSFWLRGQAGTPSTVTSPLSGCRRPSAISSVVVFPAPFGPRMP